MIINEKEMLILSILRAGINVFNEIMHGRLDNALSSFNFIEDDIDSIKMITKSSYSSNASSLIDRASFKVIFNKHSLRVRQVFDIVMKQFDYINRKNFIHWKKSTFGDIVECYDDCEIDDVLMYFLMPSLWFHDSNIKRCVNSMLKRIFNITVNSLDEARVQLAIIGAMS